MKKLFTFIVILTIALGTMAYAAVIPTEVVLNQNLAITYNGEVQRFKNVKGDIVYPISYQGTTYLPIRSISCLFETEIEWDGNTNSIHLGKGSLDTIAAESIPQFVAGTNQNILVDLNQDIKIYHNNQAQTFKDVTGKVVYPLSYQGTTYLPVRAISNLYNANIEWVGETETVVITKENEKQEIIKTENNECEITWNGKYVSNVNGLRKIELTKISDTEVNFYIRGVDNTGFFGCNNDAEIVDNIARYKYKIFNEGEIIFRFENGDLIVETSGYEDLSVFAGRYKIDDGSISKIEWTISKNPIEGEYLLGEEIEIPDFKNFAEYQDFIESVPDSVTISVSNVTEKSAVFAVGGFVDGGMTAIMGSIQKDGDKWKYYDSFEGTCKLEIVFEDGKAIVTGNDNSMSGTYIKKDSTNDLKKYEEMVEESSVGDGVFIF